MILDGAAALVTGAASGLGRATAHHLAAAGVRVIAGDRAGDKLREAFAAVPEVTTVCADITKPEDVEAMLVTAADGPPLRVVVNCAGGGRLPERAVNRHGSPVALDGWRRVVDLNVTAAFDVARRAAATMAATEPDVDGNRGVIIQVASIVGLDGSLGMSSYAAAKGALVPLVRSLAHDLAPWGIRSVAIAPGAFDTPGLAALPDAVRQARAPQFVHPKRPGRPDEFARFVQHIAENDYLNAECFRLDGGLRIFT